MPPFSKAKQLVCDLDAGAITPPITTLPGQPCILLDDPLLMRQFLESDFWSEDLEVMAPRLWIMTTFSSANINPLHRQRVKGREIILTEEARLHLVWIHDRIFIKPLPRYLLSHDFWEMFLDKPSRQLGDVHYKIRKAAMGFLRTYAYLIQRESDFNIAQQDNLRLIPKNLDWPSFCRFRQEIANIDDSETSGRYQYGELRLTRLNLYAPLLLGKFHFEQVHGQYGDFFERMYGPILFIFALVTTLLNSMQVALAAEQLVSGHLESLWYLSRWFSIVSLVGAGIISTWFILLWLWLFLDEWIYTLRRKAEKSKIARSMTSC